MARLRTSGRFSPSDTASFRKPPRPSSRTSDRQASSGSDASASWIVLAHHFSRAAANSRWRGSKNGQASQLVTLKLRPPFVGESLVGAVEVLRLHAEGLGLGLHRDRLIDRHMPFGVELALGHGVGEGWTAREIAGESLSVVQHI